MEYSFGSFYYPFSILEYSFGTFNYPFFFLEYPFGSFNYPFSLLQYSIESFNYPFSFEKFSGVPSLSVFYRQNILWSSFNYPFSLFKIFPGGSFQLPVFSFQKTLRGSSPPSGPRNLHNSRIRLSPSCADLPPPHFPPQHTPLHKLIIRGNYHVKEAEDMRVSVLVSKGKGVTPPQCLMRKQVRHAP